VALWGSRAGSGCGVLDILCSCEDATSARMTGALMIPSSGGSCGAPRDGDPRPVLHRAGIDWGELS
jgi:hypothetical protein